MKPIMKSGPCEYCGKPGNKWVGPEHGLDKDIYVCAACLQILKNPQTALPFLRGHLSQELRGQFPKEQLDKFVNEFMKTISQFRPKN